MNFIRLVVTK